MSGVSSEDDKSSTTFIFWAHRDLRERDLLSRRLAVSFDRGLVDFLRRVVGLGGNSGDELVRAGDDLVRAGDDPVDTRGDPRVASVFFGLNENKFVRSIGLVGSLPDLGCGASVVLLSAVRVVVVAGGASASVVFRLVLGRRSRSRAK